jgi:hypothetical protein
MELAALESPGRAGRRAGWNGMRCFQTWSPSSKRRARYCPQVTEAKELSMQTPMSRPLWRPLLALAPMLWPLLAQAQVSVCLGAEELERDGCRGREVRLCNVDTAPRSATVLSRKSLADGGSTQTIVAPAFANPQNGPRIGFSAWRDGTACNAWEHSITKVE